MNGPSRVQTAAWILVAAAGAGTLAAHAEESHWFFALFAHFRLHLAVAGLLGLALGAWARDPRVVALAAGACAWNVLLILPTHVAPALAPGERPLSVFLCNVDGRNQDTARLRDLIAARDPDVLALIEITPEWRTALAPVLARYPYGEVWDRTDLFGVALVSKLPMRTERVVFPRAGLPTLIGRATTPQGELRFAVAHFMMPLSAENAAYNRAQLDGYIRTFAADPSGLVLLGDFNMAPWSWPLERVRDALDLLEAERAPWAGTWPAALPVGRIQIDNVFVGPGVAASAAVVDASAGSDHRPVEITLARQP